MTPSFLTRKEAAGNPCRFTSDIAHQKAPIVGFHVSGDCPMCTHPTTDLFTLDGAVSGQGTIQVVVPPPDGVAEVGPTTEPRPAKLTVAAIHCRCVGQHPKSEGKFGCGRSWLLATATKIDPTAREHTDLAFVRVADDEASKWWPAAEAVSTAATSALTTVQSISAKWQTGVTAILALAASVVTVGNREAILNMSGRSEAWILGLGLVGLALLVAGMLFALTGNVGFPRVARVADADKLAQADLAPLQQAVQAVIRLRWSAWLFSAAFVFSLAALLTLTMTHGFPAPPKS